MKTKRFDCNSCDKTFTSLPSLEAHGRIHDKLRKFPCNFCDKTFTQKTHCNTHVKLVHDVTLIKCRLCDKELVPNYLKEHIDRVHCQIDKNKAFDCDICGKSVFSLSDKIEHMKSHENDQLRRNQNRCDICNTGFITAQSLRTHTNLIHEKNYEF